jgi:hypothetical protein
VAVAAIAAIQPTADTWSSAVRHMMHRGRAADADTLALASVPWWLAFAAALAALLLLLHRRPRWQALAATLVTLLVALDLMHAAHGFQPMVPASKALPPRTPAIAFLQEHRAEGRIAGAGAVEADWTTIYGLRDVRGLDAPQPTFRLGRLLQMTVPPTPELQLSALGPRVFGLLGARYLLFPPGVNASTGDLRLAYRGREATIYENELHAPRAFVPAVVRLASNADEEFATIAEAAFDPRREATVRLREIEGRPPPPRGRGTARVVSESNASVTIRATLARRGLVVLGDTWGPGWSVRIDGRSAQPLQANAALRGVVVPAGTHEIVWGYRVPGLRAGAALSVVALIALIAWAGVLRSRSRRVLR